MEGVEEDVGWHCFEVTMSRSLKHSLTGKVYRRLKGCGWLSITELVCSSLESAWLRPEHVANAAIQVRRRQTMRAAQAKIKASPENEQFILEDLDIGEVDLTKEMVVGTRMKIQQVVSTGVKLGRLEKRVEGGELNVRLTTEGFDLIVAADAQR